MDDIINIIVDDDESRKNIQLSKDLAFRSKMIKNMIGDCSANYVLLPNWSSPNLIHIKNLLENIGNNDLIIDYFKSLPTAAFFSLLKTINYLDIPSLLDIGLNFLTNLPVAEIPIEDINGDYLISR